MEGERASDRWRNRQPITYFYGHYSLFTDTTSYPMNLLGKNQHTLSPFFFVPLDWKLG